MQWRHRPKGKHLIGDVESKISLTTRNTQHISHRYSYNLKFGLTLGVFTLSDKVLYTLYNSHRDKFALDKLGSIQQYKHLSVFLSVDEVHELDVSVSGELG